MLMKGECMCVNVKMYPCERRVYVCGRPIRPLITLIIELTHTNRCVRHTVVVRCLRCSSLTVNFSNLNTSQQRLINADSLFWHLVSHQSGWNQEHGRFYTAQCNPVAMLGKLQASGHLNRAFTHTLMYTSTYTYSSSV